MKEHIYTTGSGIEIRIRYYSDRLEIVVGGLTHSFPNGDVVKYIRNACNVYLAEYPLDGEIISQEEKESDTNIDTGVTT